MHGVMGCMVGWCDDVWVRAVGVSRSTRCFGGDGGTLNGRRCGDRLPWDGRRGVSGRMIGEG